MPTKALRDELDQLTSTADSEAFTPRFRGDSGTDVTKNTERLSLSDAFLLVESSDTIQREERHIGTLLAMCVILSWRSIVKNIRSCQQLE